MKRIKLQLAERSPEERATFLLYNAIEEPLLRLDRAIIALDDLALHTAEAKADLNPWGVLFIAEAMRQHFDAVQTGLKNARASRRRKPQLAVVPSRAQLPNRESAATGAARKGGPSLSGGRATPAAMSTGAVTLAQYPADHVELACSKCDRRGRYRKESLVAIHGGAIGLPDLRMTLAADCPLMRNKLGNETCGAVYPALVQLS